MARSELLHLARWDVDGGTGVISSDIWRGMYPILIRRFQSLSWVSYTSGHLFFHHRSGGHCSHGYVAVGFVQQQPVMVPINLSPNVQTQIRLVQSLASLPLIGAVQFKLWQQQASVRTSNLKQRLHKHCEHFFSLLKSSRRTQVAQWCLLCHCFVARSGLLPRDKIIGPSSKCIRHPERSVSHLPSSS